MSPKSKTIAFLLCLFFGCQGFHRFYVGKIGTGILYLVTFGFCGIGWIFDLLSIVLGYFRDSNGLYVGKKAYLESEFFIIDLLLNIITFPVILIHDMIDDWFSW